MERIIKSARTDEDLFRASRLNVISWRAVYKGHVPQDYLDEMKDDHWLTAYQQGVAQGRLQVDLLYIDGYLVGNVCYGAAEEERWQGWGELKNFHILSPYWGQGHGGFLFSHAKEQLIQMGYGQVYLWVLGKNERAIRFYQKQGLQLTGETYQFSFNGGVVTDLGMIMPLITP